MTRFRRTRSAGEDDAGIALLLVIGSMLVLAMLALTALAFTVSSQKFARYDQDYSSTMSAAQSGIDDYISRLNRDDGYFQAVDCTNVALRGPSVPGNTCGWTPATPVGWLPVDPGETGTRTPSSTTRSTRPRGATEGTITVAVDRQGQRRVPHRRGGRRQGRVDRLRLLHRLRVGGPVERAVVHGRRRSPR